MGTPPKPEAHTIRAVCVTCRDRPQRKRGNGRAAPRYGAECGPCHYLRYPRPDRDRVQFPYRRHLKDRCERCDFVPEDTCQLDIDHADGDHSNDDPANLVTLCANCHRLKTKRSKDNRKRKTAALR